MRLFCCPAKSGESRLRLRSVSIRKRSRSLRPFSRMQERPLRRRAVPVRIDAVDFSSAAGFFSNVESRAIRACSSRPHRSGSVLRRCGVLPETSRPTRPTTRVRGCRAPITTKRLSVRSHRSSPLWRRRGSVGKRFGGSVAHPGIAIGRSAAATPARAPIGLSPCPIRRRSGRQVRPYGRAWRVRPVDLDQ